MPNFSIPLSGLTAASQALAVISNNLANLNTVGFKESRASFTDLFYQAFGTNGANDPIQVGEGVALGSVTPTFTGGNLEGTGVPTDVAITGNGLFVTQKNGVEQYTRAGNFTVDCPGPADHAGGTAGDGISGGEWRYQPIPDPGAAPDQPGTAHSRSSDHLNPDPDQSGRELGGGR